MKFFRSTPAAPPEPRTQERLSRRSSAMAELSRILKTEDPLCVLDIGATSASNIRFFTERGHKIYSQDLLEASAEPSLAISNEQGLPTLDSKKFLEENLAYPNTHFDLVFCWNLADYLDESLVKPVIGRLWSEMKPGGMLLAFFHTREAGPDAPYYRYHITATDVLEMQVLNAKPRKDRAKNFALQRVFNNRHIENLFRDFASIKFFLSRDNVREVLVIR
ncbi:MAG TPA: methyltransferase domain-containing protein [Terriglobales bacterium]|jgi:SAM-dependent methyltransferase|nr:methyltransferase domain-containing protein [Terriglobales bacterium]